MDTMSRGAWKQTTSVTSDSTTRQDIINFFGLRGGDVLDFKITCEDC